MDDRRIMVIGSEGLVGHALMMRLVRQYTNVFPVSHRAMEIRSALQVSEVIQLIAPDVVFLCAALTHVDYCEERPDLSNEFNLAGPTNVVDECGKKRIVIFFSSSYVFDGNLTGRNYLPNDPICPINVYGKHKAEMEKRVMEANPNNLVIRTIGVIGKEAKQKNFGYQIFGAASIHRTIYVPIDQIMNPVLSDDLAGISVDLVHSHKTGIHHVAGDTCKTKFEFALDISKEADLPTGNIVGKMTDDMNQRAARPLNGCLDVNGLSALHLRIPEYKTMLRRFVNDH